MHKLLGFRFVLSCKPPDKNLGTNPEAQEQNGYKSFIDEHREKARRKGRYGRQMIEKLYARERRETKKRDGAVIIFKTPYTPLTRKLGIQHEFSKLKCDIQRILGNNVRVTT